MDSDALVGLFIIFFLIGLVYALRHVIAHLFLTTIAIGIIVYFLGTPEQNGWWSLIGFMFIFGQILMAKEELVDKPTAKRAAQKALVNRQEAEDYIMSSGDPEAIKMLMLARANPANYSQILSGGMNKGNNTLKTALGVMTGVVAGNMISNAIAASSVQSALDDMHVELNNIDIHESESGSFAEVVDGGGFDDIDVT